MSNLDDFDTTYRKVHGFHIIGYDADTDTFSKLHIDQNGHIYAKLLADKDGAMQELSVDENAGALKVETDLGLKDILGEILNELKIINVHLQTMTDENITEEDVR